jgi:hypothetical protein
MKWCKIIEAGAAVGAATLAGVNAYQHKREENNRKKSLFTKDHIALYSALIAAGMALWEIKKHQQQHLAA